MDEIELQKMVVRMVADTEEFTSGMEEAGETAEETGEDVEEHSKEVEGFGESIKTYALSAVSALGSILGAAQLKDMFNSFSEAEAIEVKLTAAIKATGQAVDDVLPSYKEWADKIQATTTVEGDFALGLIKTATNLGLTGEAAQKAADDAIALAALNDTSADSMIRFTAALAKGDTEQAMMFARMVPQLRGVKDEQEFIAKAQQAIATGWETETASAGTAAGSLKQLENAYGDIKEELGAVVAEGVKPVVDFVKELVKWFQDLSPVAKQAIVIVAGLGIAIAAAVPALVAVNLIWQSMTGGLLLITGIIVSVIAGLAALTISLGGVGATFQKVKDAAMAAWDWLLPVRKAIVSLFNSIVEIATDVWEWVKQKAIDAWEAITGDAEVNWDEIREYIVEAFIAAEYGIRNFGTVAKLVWATIKLEAAEALNSIVGRFNEVLTEVGLDTIEIIDTAQLKKDFDEAKGIVQEGYDAFKDAKMKEFFAPEEIPEEVKQEAKKTGEEIGKQLMKGVVQEVKATDAVLVGSAEAIAKIAEYRERLKASGPVAAGLATGGGGIGGTGGIGGGIGGSGIPFDAQQVSLAEVMSRKEMIALLTSLNKTLEKVEVNTKNPRIAIAAAGL